MTDIGLTVVLLIVLAIAYTWKRAVLDNEDERRKK